MNTKTFRIILGVLCIVAFLAAMFMPVISIKGEASLSLCDLISLNKTMGSSPGMLAGLSGAEGAMLDGITVLAVLGFIAAMCALLTSYLALIHPIPKIFAGISGIIAGAAAIGTAVCAIVLKDRFNGLVPMLDIASVGWGAIVLMIFGIGMLSIAIVLLILKERAQAVGRAGMRSAASSPTGLVGSGEIPPAPTAYSPAYPSYTRREGAYASPASGYTGYGASKAGYDPSGTQLQGGYTPVSPVYITGIDGAYKDARFDVSDGSQVNFGRDASVCQIVFDKYDTIISRRHLAIRYNANHDMFEALDMSRNGTFVDGLSKKLPTGETQFLPHGTVLYVGSSRDAFRLD